PFCGLYKWRAALVVVIIDLTIQALKPYGHDNPAGRLNRPHRARPLAQMARIAAFRAALEKVDQVQPVEGRQHAAERTQETAIGALGEQSDPKQYPRIEHVGPSACE